MPTALRSLKEQASDTTARRGHRMSKFYNFPSGTRARAHCLQCPATVDVQTHPRPNEIDIAGSAVAMNCDGENWERVCPSHCTGMDSMHGMHPGHDYQWIGHGPKPSRQYIPT